MSAQFTISYGLRSKCADLSELLHLPLLFTGPLSREVFCTAKPEFNGTKMRPDAFCVHREACYCSRLPGAVNSNGYTVRLNSTLQHFIVSERRMQTKRARQYSGSFVILNLFFLNIFQTVKGYGYKNNDS